MSSPKKNVAYDFYISLVDSADTGAFKAAPTIAAGDFQVSGDGAAFANLATLPVVDPAGSIGVKVSLSAAEMNFDKIMVQCIDAAGDEWDDVLIFIDATVANVDDIGYSTSYAGPRGPGVYLNDAAANTNTVNGVDGTLNNPVSTIAAAKTIADSLGVDRIYLVNNSSVTLIATMEDYEIIGIGEMTANAVNYGSQDVDRTVFYNLLLTGTQGGTGRCQAEGCCLSVIAGMEITALGCLLADAGSLTLRNDCAFDRWWSAVAGGGTPKLNINSVANVNAYLRHGSGGIQIDNAVATTVMSVETDGQVIVGATSTSLEIHVRGNCSITDNGTTTDLNRDAAINLTNINAEVHGREIHYVATDGNDSNSGRSWDQARLTPKTVIEAASANDLVILGPGTFTMGDVIIDVPNGVSVRGAGMDVTTLTSTATFSGGSPKGVILKPGTNSEIEDLTVRGIAGGGSLYQACFGVHSTYQTDFQNVVIRRCRGFANNDCVYVKDATPCNWILEDCLFESEWDIYAHITSITGHSAILRRCHLIANATGAANAVVTVGGTIRLEDCTLEATTASTTARAISVQGVNASLYAFNTRLRSSGGTPLDVFQATSGTVTLVGCEYDRSKTSGTVTDVARVVTDTSGQVALTSGALAGVVDEWETQSQADPTGFHVNVKELDGDASALAALAAMYGGTVARGTVDVVTDDGDFTLTSSDLSANNNDYDDMWFVLLDNNNKFVPRAIGTYTGATKRVQFTGSGLKGAFPQTVVSGDAFAILAGSA